MFLFYLDLNFVITKNSPIIAGSLFGHGACKFVIIHIVNFILKKNKDFVNVDT